MASLVSPIAGLLIPTIGSFLSVFTSIGNTTDPMDDAPQRAAALMLFVIIPVAYPVWAIIVFLLTFLLQKLRLFFRRTLAILVLVPSLVLGIWFGIQSPFGAKDQLIGVAVFFCVFAICFGLGGLVWWLLARPRHNTQIKATVI